MTNRTDNLGQYRCPREAIWQGQGVDGNTVYLLHHTASWRWPGWSQSWSVPRQERHLHIGFQIPRWGQNKKRYWSSLSKLNQEECR